MLTDSHQCEENERGEQRAMANVGGRRRGRSRRARVSEAVTKSSTPRQSALRDESQQYNRESFSRRLKERATELGLSFRQVAQKAGIDPSFMTRIVATDRNPPSDENIERLARALEMPKEELYVYAGRIPSGVKDSVRRVLPAFFRIAEPLSEDQLQKLLDFVGQMQFQRKED